MRLSALIVLFITCLGSLFSTVAQTPVADFTVPASSCLQATLPVINQSSNATQYVWDFCDKDLTTVSGLQIMTIVPTAVTPLSIKTVYDKGTWYGFVASRDNNSFIRLDFGNSLDNDPGIVDLGNPGGLLSQPGNIDFVEEGNIWYGLVANRGGAGSIIRLKFSSGLGNAPTAEDVGTMGHLSSIGDLEIVLDGSSWRAVATNYNNNLIHVVDFGNSITNFPVGSDVLDVSSGLISNPYGLQVENNAGTWFVLVASSGGTGITRFQFGNGLMSQPTNASTIYTVPFSTDVSLDLEGGEYRMYVSTVFGDLHYVNLGSSLSGAPVSFANLGNLGILNNTYGFCVARSAPEWRGFTIDYATKRVFRLTYRNSCSGVPKQSSVEVNPSGIIYSQPGTYSIELTSFSANERQSTKQKQVSVSALTAPDIQISSQNNCAGNAVNFFSTSMSGNIASYAWSFGDGHLGNSQNPTNIYSAAGTYSPSLTVTASNGCTNTISNSLPVYNVPAVDFILPATLPVCTNQNYILTNTSVFDPASNPSWTWSLNGMSMSSQQNYTAIFVSPTSQSISLKASIPGCTNEVIKNISSVTAGPMVSFAANDACDGTNVPFNNSTTGADAGYVWNFGDSNSSTAVNPSHQYAGPAVYQVTLTAANSMGCNNSLTQTVHIYSKPVPDFSVSLPPFSCSNSPTQFQNISTPLTDSNFAIWNWNFGDSGTSGLQTPTHTFTNSGNFNVTLTSTSDKGCIGVRNRNINISVSPSANFSFGPACLNQTTHFADQSGGGPVSRLWQIASSSFNTSNPTYTFSSPGTYPVTLTVTGGNGCINVLTKNVIVSAAVIPNFVVNNVCAGKPSTFTDATVSPADPVIGWSWNIDGNSFAGNPTSYTFSTAGTYNVKLTTTHSLGCQYNATHGVTINPSPVAAFTASPDRGAAPLLVQFSNNSLQANQYQWKFYDKVTTTSSSPSTAYTFTSLGDYSAELTATNALGCSDKLTLPIKVLVPALDLIMSDFSLVNDPASGKLKCVVTITNNSNVPVVTSEVSVHLADKAIVNETVTLNLNPGQSAIRTLSFTLSPSQFEYNFLCASINLDQDAQQDNNKKCLNLDGRDYFFSPYPNPTSGILQVDWISKSGGMTSLVVYDNFGRTSYAWETPTHAGLNQAILDLTFLSAGTYFVRVTTSESQKTIRFVRQ